MDAILCRGRLGAAAVDFFIAINEHVEAEGAAVFAAACRMGLEGIVSKRTNALNRSGRSRDWIKTRTPIAQRCGV